MANGDPDGADGDPNGTGTRGASEPSELAVRPQVVPCS